MRRTALLVATAVLLAWASPALAEQPDGSSPVSYRPPVDAPVSDPFRPPPHPWSPGNRGVEYATEPGTQALAAADGEVVFAGPVAGSLHVVVLHPDGIRTSYSFLESVAVHRGDKVRQGQSVGTTGPRLHFGARLGDVYIDPARLFDLGPPVVYLVPDEVRKPASESRERSGLLGMLAGVGGDALRAGADGMAWARDRTVEGAGTAARLLGGHASGRLEELRGALHYLREADPVVHIARVAGTTAAWWRQRGNCTPPGVPTPDAAEGHVAVLVGGLDSSSTSSPIDHVDTESLGYRPPDVMRFSYRGGTVDEQPYEAADTAVDIRRSARRLRELLERVAADRPGVPVDILAHSQGGIVARAALAYERDAANGRLPPLNALVTLASPHQGADLATALTMAGHTTPGYLMETAANGARPEAADLRGTAVHQLAEMSDFLARLNDRPLPRRLRVTSIGGRGDLIVPGGRTRLDGAHNVILAPPGVTDQHSRLPGTAAARREIALGLAGLPPTCQGLADMLTDAAVSESIGWLEDAAGAAVWAGGRPIAGVGDPTQFTHPRRNP